MLFCYQFVIVKLQLVQLMARDLFLLLFEFVNFFGREKAWDQRQFLFRICPELRGILMMSYPVVLIVGGPALGVGSSLYALV